MPFEYDIFISYGHLDDDPATGAVKGWIDYLVEQLPKEMAGPLGYVPKIWRDEQSLHGNDLLTGAIKDGIERSLLFVPVMTPRYVLSDWCQRELELFCAAQPPASGSAFRSRIFKVVKTPLVLPHVRDREPEQLRDMVGYEFYTIDGGRPVEFKPSDEQTSVKYFTQLQRLAWEMMQMLSQLKAEAKTHSAPAPVPACGAGDDDEDADDAQDKAESGGGAAASNNVSAAASNSGSGGASKPAKFVYLAETTRDVSDERELVRDELRQRGYGVLPEPQTKLPLETCEELSSAVRGYVERCCLSVHLVGAVYGSTPEDDEERSVVRIQEELAAERSSSDPGFRRLLWMPPGLAVKQGSKQEKFVSELQARIGEGSELLQTSVEDLKTRIVEKLEPPRPPARARRRERLKQVYLICEDGDSDRVWPIKQYLFNQKLEVVTRLDGGTEDDTARILEYHRRNLKECDAALIYFGGGDEPWVRTYLADIVKACGYEREDWSASALYIGAPENKQKEQFLTWEVPYVIRNYEEFDPEDLRDFVSDVKSAGEGARGQ